MQVWGKNVKKWKTWGSKKNVVNKELLKLTRILLLLKQNLKTCHHMNLQKMTKSVTFLANDWFYLVVWVMMWVYRHMVAGDLNHFQYMELILWLTALRHHSKLWFLFFCYHQMYWCTYQKKKKKTIVLVQESPMEDCMYRFSIYNCKVWNYINGHLPNYG